MGLKYTQCCATALWLLFLCTFATAQYPVIRGVPAEVDFSEHLRIWDGFGFNYVETAHTYDYEAYPQEYGGFSLLDEDETQEVIDLVFGEEGLKVSLVKMFLDPLHQKEPGGIFNHAMSAGNMVEFAQLGLARTRQRGDDLTVITTLYGLPAWATLQDFDHGRDLHRWYANHNSAGIDLVRDKRPGLHAWVTSTGWGNMDALFIREIYGNMYTSKVNAIIPWAGIQRPTQWEGRDPNAGCAFVVNEDGSYEIRKGYYFYKQVSRAGQAGMAVARTWAMDSQTPVIAFASNGTANPDALVVVNWADNWDKNMAIRIRGSNASSFHGYRTDQDGESYADIGIVELEDGVLYYRAPIGTVTTFFAVIADSR